MDWLILIAAVFIFAAGLAYACLLTFDHRHEVYVDDRHIKVLCPVEKREFQIQVKAGSNAFICPGCGRFVGIPTVKYQWKNGNIFRSKRKEP